MKGRQKLPMTLGFYSFLEQIGQGGFSQVFLVQHRNYSTKFVAKVIKPEQSEIESRWEIFKAEVKALSTLNHPHIIRLYDHFKIQNQFFLVLEFCPNKSVHDEVSDTEGLSVPRFGELAAQIVDALCYCHKNGVAHRDIKPSNVLLDAYYRAKIADFGLSAQTDPTGMTEKYGGSLHYLAPEILQKRKHNPMMADIWALGVTFAVMLMGRSPWASESLGGLKKLALAGKYRLSRRIPDILKDLIGKMLLVEPSERLTVQGVRDHPFFKTMTGIPRELEVRATDNRWDDALGVCRSLASQMRTQIVDQRVHKPKCGKVFEGTDDVVTHQVA